MLTKKLRQKIYDKYNGHCAYCGSEITLKEMQIDHIRSKKYNNGTDDESNLNPSCRACNFYKSDFDLEEFRNMLKTLHERIMKPFISRLGLKYGIIEIKKFDGKFYFEK